jgi:hypothetical protein
MQQQSNLSLKYLIKIPRFIFFFFLATDTTTLTTQQLTGIIHPTTTVINGNNSSLDQSKSSNNNLSLSLSQIAQKVNHRHRRSSRYKKTKNVFFFCHILLFSF